VTYRFYDNDLTGPIREEDSDAVKAYKAGTGALSHALKVAGWTEEQIANSLRTHFDATATVLADHLRIWSVFLQSGDVVSVAADELEGKR
jgi:hypothetical protein